METYRLQRAACGRAVPSAPLTDDHFSIRSALLESLAHVVFGSPFLIRSSEVSTASTVSFSFSGFGMLNLLKLTDITIGIEALSH